jgi:MoxR-like ATPase
MQKAEQEASRKSETTMSSGDVASIDQLRDLWQKMRLELAKVIIGQEEVIEQLLICILARGHALLMGVPGLAKTTIVNSLSQVMSLEFNRIQFTPDLMPSDITGTDILQETDQPGRRAFVFTKGPVFANIVLADEINRCDRCRACLSPPLTLLRPGHPESHRTGRHLFPA